MPKIILLDELTANKIAAGEVVERPASVVKELVENSIDAGSTRIEISITDGGLDSIVVSDNGSGMDPDDARLAFERHATSKIKDARDLERIASLGFRGEALPSIAAVSRVNLKTRTGNALAGTEISIEGGRIRSVGEAGCPAGTRIEVRDLFFNTPARKKHMKKPTTEAGHISDIVSKLAMGYPDIAFLLRHNDKLVLQTSGKGNLLECIAGVYGPEIAREMLPVKFTDGAVSVEGYVGKPSLSRSWRHHQTVYINGRYVRNRTVSEAVEKAYHGMMMVGRYPVFVLKLEAGPEEVDVNVHPAKTEVRLVNAAIFEEAVISAVKNALSSSRLIPQSTVQIKKSPAAKVEYRQEEWQTVSGRVSAAFKACESPAKDYGIVRTDAAEVQDAEVQDIQVQDTEVQNTEVPDIEIPDYEGIGREEQEHVQEEREQVKEEGTFPELIPIGQIELTYIVARGPDGMYIIDQHAAHERILYEKYMDRPEEFTAAEQLIFPETLELTHQEALLLNDNIMALTDLGFVVEHFGGETFLLRAVPAGVAKKGGKEIFLDLLDYFSRNRSTISIKELKEAYFITMACRNAVKANDRLSLPEMESLLSQLALAENPYTCPHGRPTVIHFPVSELEKRFKRVL